MATFSLTQNNISFTKVSEISSYPAALPYGPSAYESSSEQAASKKLINVVDIDWNGAKPGIGESTEGITTTGELLTCIKNLYNRVTALENAMVTVSNGLVASLS